MNLTLYKFSGDRIDVPKNSKLTIIRTITGACVDGFSSENPTIKTGRTNELFQCNYFYIKETMRYYYLTNLEIQDNQFAKISGHVDVLQTYWDDIKYTEQKISRQENKYNMLLRDSIMVSDCTSIKQVKLLENPDFIFKTSPEDSGNCYFLSTL